jgi:class III poly(R)-hydroxyalkanoic acid synthase PhaE subunit
MQEVAARFAGRDASSAEVAQAWREAVQGQGEGMLQWMLQGARGSTQAAAAVPEFAAWLQQFQLQAGPWLQSPAFGPGREHQARWQALLRAQEDYQQHSRAYVEQIKQVLEQAFALFEQRLAQHEQPGSQLTSARAMFDLWIEVAEEAYAKVALSEPFQQVYAALGNAQMRLRAGLQREIEQMSERIGLPTRSEMDTAHRRIAELERSLRRLQAQVAVLAGTAAVDPVAQPAPAKVKPAARTAAKKAAPAKKPPAKKTSAKTAAPRASARARN